MKNQSETVVINNTSFTIRRDSQGRINANDAHRASGGKPNKRANYFLNNKKAKVLVNDLIAAGIPAPITTTSSGETGIRGGGSTWMYEDVFFAYCAWIDDEFYSIVAQVFGHAARGDGDAAVDAARSVVRIKGIEVRKKATASWARAGAKGFDYQWATDLGYVVSRGKKASELRKEKGLEPKTNLREHSTDDELNKDIIWETASTVACEAKPQGIGFRAHMIKAASATQNFFETLANL